MHMRLLATLPLMLLMVGCRHFHDASGQCGEDGGSVQPQCEVQPAEPLHVKAPPQKIVIETPPAPPCAPAPQPLQQAPQPLQQAPQPMVVQPSPVQAAPAPQVMMAPAQLVQQPAPLMAANTSTEVRTGDRIALGIEWIRIPFPCPKLFHVPGGQRVITETDFQPVAPASAPLQQVAYPQQLVAPAPQTIVSPQPYTVAPQQYVVAPQPVQSAPCQQTTCQPRPGSLTQPSSAEVEELRKQLEEAEKLLKERSATPKQDDCK
jgi:hypothetical protein